MVEVTCYSGATRSVSAVDVDISAFGDKVRKRLLRQAYLHYAAAHRQGTHSTLTRGEVNYNERKPYKQKGTGRARAGDFSSPIWRGGGIVFGPKPRSYVTRFPRRMRREALRSAFLGKLQGGQVRLVEGLSFDAPKTKDAVGVLKALGVAGQRVVLVIAERGENLFRSFRNLPRVSVVEARELNAEHVLGHEVTVIDRRAVDQIVGRVSHA